MTAIIVLLRRPRIAPGGAAAAQLLGRCDEATLRAGLALRAAAAGARLTVVAAGPPDRESALLRHALARGADRAVRIWDPGLEGVDYHAIAQVLAAATRKLGFDLVLVGDRSDDEGDGAVGPAVAEALDVPHLTSALDVTLDGHTALVSRRDDGLLRTLRVSLPALVTVVRSSAVAGPARIALTGDVEILSLDALGIHAPELRPRLCCLGIATRVEPPGPTLLGRPDELIARLRSDHLLDP